MNKRIILLVVGLVAAWSLFADEPKPGGIKIEALGVSLKFGILLQPQYESVGSATKEGTSKNIFLRRTRILFAGTFAKSFELFLETDSPDLGKSDANGAKTSSYSGLKIQDAVLTYKVNEQWRVDAGLLLVPSAHQSNQGATSLNGLDYGKYSFDQNAMMDNNAGRDTGVMARGVLFKKHVEARLGLFQGKREAGTAQNVQSRNSLRMAGRLQINLFDAEGGMFLGGTYAGAKKIVSFGVAHDRQGDYRMTACDAFIDLPLGRNVLTTQVDFWFYDGTGYWALPKRTALFAEASYRFKRFELAPLVRIETRKMKIPSAALPDETRLGLGLAWWFKGHTSNLKMFWQRVKPDAPGALLADYSQFNMQWQLFYF